MSAWLPIVQFLIVGAQLVLFAIAIREWLRAARAHTEAQRHLAEAQRLLGEAQQIHRAALQPRAPFTAFGVRMQ